MSMNVSDEQDIVLLEPGLHSANLKVSNELGIRQRYSSDATSTSQPSQKLSLHTLYPLDMRMRRPTPNQLPYSSSERAFAKDVSNRFITTGGLRKRIVLCTFGL